MNILEIILGLFPQQNIETVRDIGVSIVTIFPINSSESKRYLEVLLPFEVGFPHFFKESGYAIEVKQVDEYNQILNNPEISNNLNSVFVHKMSGLSSQLLDMSPSPNIYGTSSNPYYDIRDVVLKSGMIYENDDVKFSNVIQNANGSFTLDVEIKNAKQLTPAPTLLNVTRSATNQIQINWQNNHLTSGNDANIVVQYQNDISSNYWQNIGEVNNTISSYIINNGAAYPQNFRVYVKENATNFTSRFSNIDSENCNLVIEDLEEYPVECFGSNTGKIEVLLTMEHRLININ